MNYVLVVFASATTANRVKSVLQKKFGIKSVLIQTPKSLNVKGCSFCLKTESANVDTIWKIVTDNGLSSKGAFREEDYFKIR